MTAEEFERGYAERSKVTVDELHAMGLYPVPCDCGSDMCEGWKMDWENRAKMARLTRKPPRELAGG